MDSAKYSVFVIWLGSAAAVVLGDASTAQIGRTVFLVTLAAHLGEFAWKRSLFQRVGGDMSHHFVQTMIYGLFYWKPIEDRLKSR